MPGTGQHLPLPLPAAAVKTLGDHGYPRRADRSGGRLILFAGFSATANRLAPRREGFLFQFARGYLTSRAADSANRNAARSDYLWGLLDLHPVTVQRRNAARKATPSSASRRESSKRPGDQKFARTLVSGFPCWSGGDDCNYSMEEERIGG